ncbi:MAG: hypothetical protein H0X23_07590, partial [Rubrobacter sp.]|nr:hypothetical protein [Rubrobacter sp.]
MTHRLRLLDVWVVLFVVVALVVIGPLRGAFEASPLVLFIGVLVLFMAPGVLLTHWFLSERLPGATTIPVSFVISTGLFGLLGV